MNRYYFTFGQVHETVDGEPLKDYWVEVLAEDAGVARCIFIAFFAVAYLPKYDKWSMQYSEESFNSGHFPRGAFKSYRQDAIRDQMRDE